MVSPLLSTVSLSVLAGAGWFWLTGNRSVAGPELDPLDNVTFSPPQTRSSPVEDLVRFKLQIETITPSIDDILTEKWLIMMYVECI